MTPTDTIATLRDAIDILHFETVPYEVYQPRLGEELWQKLAAAKSKLLEVHTQLEQAGEVDIEAGAMAIYLAEGADPEHWYETTEANREIRRKEARACAEAWNMKGRE